MKPLKFLELIIYLLPLWWALGLIELLLFFYGLGSLFFFIIDKGYKKLLNYELVFIPFLFSCFISVLFLYDISRLLEFVRNISSFCIMVFGSYYLRKICTVNNENVNRVIKLVVVLFFWSIVGAIISFFIQGITFNAPIEMLIPESLKQYALIRILYTKSLGDIYYSIFGDFWRPTGFYTFQASLAVTLALMLPILHFYARSRKNSFKINFFIVLGVLVIILSTTRIAILATILFYTLLYFHKVSVKAKIFLVGLFLATYLYLGYLVEYFIGVDLSTLVEMRGEGSTSFRTELYKLTLDYFLQRPIFGWGAQIPHPNFYAALGSHSTYMNFLLCYGIVGTFFFFLVILLCIKSAYKRRMKYLIFSWIIFFIVSLTEVFHLDYLTLLVVTVLIALSSTLHLFSTKSISPSRS